MVSDFFDGLVQWNNIAHTPPEHNYLVYGGSLHQKRTAGNLIGWKEVAGLVAALRA